MVSCWGRGWRTLNLFLQAIRQNRWDDSLPGTAAFYPGDIPPAPAATISHRLAEHVMAQVESETNLDRWHDPAGRLVTLILVRAGLRISSVDNAASCGHIRMAEMNQQVASNLDRMIGELETGHDEPEETTHAG